MKQTFIVGVETEKKYFSEWIEEHDKEMYNKALEDVKRYIRNHRYSTDDLMDHLIKLEKK